MKENKIKIYHGSPVLIEQPRFGKGKKHNDFGQGFYCTENIELAKEWAVTSTENGYVNCYELDLEGLNVLDLNCGDYNILNWIALLVQYRVFSLNNPIARRARQYLINNYSINVNAYDVIIGYRADDSYFDFAETFLNNGISIEQLSKAMTLGKLGEQIVVKSEYAFSKLRFVKAEDVKMKEYWPLRSNRSISANKQYLSIVENVEDGIFIQDIIRGKINEKDLRIQRNICK